MSDLAEAAQAPYVHPSFNVEFPILSVKEDLSAIGSHIKAERSRQAQELSKSKKWAEVDTFRVLLDVQWTDVKVSEILNYVQTPQGACKAIELSLKKAGKSDEEIAKVIEQMMPGQMVEVALIVSRGMKRPTPEQDEAQQNPT